MDRCTFQHLLRQADTADPAVTIAAVQRLLDRYNDQPNMIWLEDAASLLQRLLDAHQMQSCGVSISPLCARLSEGSFRE